MKETESALRLKQLISDYGLSQARLAKLINAPTRTVEDWCRGISNPPEYVVDLIEYYVAHKIRKPKA